MRVIEGERDRALEEKQRADERANAMEVERDRAREEKQAAEYRTSEMEGRMRAMECERDWALEEKHRAENRAIVMKSERDRAREEKHAAEKKTWEMKDSIRAMGGERDETEYESQLVAESAREMKPSRYYGRRSTEERVESRWLVREGEGERSIYEKEETDQSFVMSAIKPNLGKLALCLRDLTWAEVKLMTLQLSTCIDFDTLRKIEESNKDTSDRLLCAMDTWLKSDTEASWKKIVEALIAIGKTVLAKTLEETICSSPEASIVL